MKDEIKEILDYLKNENNYDEFDMSGTSYIELSQEQTKILLDYITNLQESEAYYYGQYKDYKSRNEKAIELINEMLECAYIDGKYIMYDYSTNEILEIKKTLTGGDEE